MRKELVLITGATGFIGSHVANEILSEDKFQLVAIVRRANRYKNVDELKKKGGIIVEGDFYNKYHVEKIFKKFPVQHVIHIAALRGAGAGSQEEYFEINVVGTEILLEAAFIHRVNKFVFCSTVGVFGTIPKDLPANVNTELNGDNAYHKSKILAEKKVLKYISRGLDGYIVRPTITYGGGDIGFPATLVKLVKKRVLLLPKKKLNIHLLNVNSFAVLLIKLIRAEKMDQRIFIAADNAPIELEDLVNLIYFHYYKIKYPRFLRLPTTILKILSIVFRVIGNEKWLTRLLLITEDWYYEITESVKALNYTPTRTKESFQEYLNSL